MTETELLWSAIGRAPHVLPHVRIFRREIYSGATATGGYIKIGRPGQGDAYWMARGVTRYYGEIEAKSHRGVLGEKQVKWRAFCADMGIPHLIWKARKGETPDATVARWLEELREKIHAVP